MNYTCTFLTGRPNWRCRINHSASRMTLLLIFTLITSVVSVAQTTYTITNSGFTYSPSSPVVQQNDIITVNVNFANHPLAEVSRATWMGDQTSPTIGSVTSTGSTMSMTMGTIGIRYFTCTAHAGHKFKVTTCNGTVTPVVSISANPGNTITSGTSVTFTATPTYGGDNPSYKWLKNGLTTGATSATYTSSSFNDGDVIQCELTSDYGCASPTKVNSNNLTMSITAPCTLTVGITATPSLTITSGSSATLTASGATSYTWSTGATTAAISTTAAGTYSVTGVTGACSATASAQVSVTTPACGTVVFVTQAGAGAKDGSSWANAFDNTQLQQAITLATTCSAQVWVAAGTYKPTTGTDRTISFAMAPNVAIYGGFVGNEATLIARPTINLATPSSTTLSGDIGSAGNADNSYHIILNPSGLTNTAILDGFVITGGNTTGGLIQNGGGIYNSDSSPTINNCRFIQNTTGVQQGYGGGIYNISGNPSISYSSFSQNSAYNGGGIYSESASLTLINSQVTSNSANQYGNGGGLYVKSGSASTSNSTFSQNNSYNGGGIYSESASLTLTSSQVTSNSASSSGNGGGIYSTSSSILTVNSSTIAQGSAYNGGGISSTSSSTLIITGSTIAQNTANSGGGINSQSSSRLNLTNCLFSQNRSSTNGGGLTNDGNTSQVTSCTFSQNQAPGISGGGGIYNSYVTSNSITSSVFESNTATRGAGVSHNGGSFTNTITGSQFNQNIATGTNFADGGGGIYCGNSTNNSVTNCSFSANIGNSGGGIYSTGNQFTLSTSQFTSNTATASSNTTGGGALYLTNNSTLSSILSCTFSQNASAGYGGAFMSGNSTPGVSMTACSFSQNVAANGGGLGFNGMKGVLTNCNVTQNTATTGGGGIYGTNVYSGNITIINSSISRNAATTGGGIYGSNVSNPVLILNSILSRNAATTDGGALAGTYTSFSVTNGSFSQNTAPKGSILSIPSGYAPCPFINSILWGNGTPTANFSVASGVSVSLKNSIADPTSSTYTNGGNNLTKNPLFTDAANDNLTLTGCSPAINTGDNASNTTSTDLAGNVRVFNTTIDMGAYEFQSTPTTTLSISISAMPSLTITSGSSATLTTSGADTYSWSTGATTAAISATAAGTYSVTGITGACSATASAVVSLTSNLPVDLTPTISLPQAFFAASGPQATRNFSIALFEVNGKPTSTGTVVITVSAPAGYTLAFDNTLTSINITGGLDNPVSVSNTNWTQTNNVENRQLTLTIKSGQGIPAMGQLNLGLSITRTSANAGSASNITVNITDDGAVTYDSNTLNNTYARVINGL